MNNQIVEIVSQIYNVNVKTKIFTVHIQSVNLTDQGVFLIDVDIY